MATMTESKKELKTGDILWTRGISAAVEKDIMLMFFVQVALNRHVHGDWGDVCDEDKEANNYDAEHGERVISSYKLPHPFDNGMGEEDHIWIITEWDRSYTIILFPSEY